MARRRSWDGWLPEEIMFKILSRLAVKSLVQFKSVCKLWRFIIADNRFIQTHLANSHAVVLNYRSDLGDFDCVEVHDTHQDSVKLYRLPPSEAPIEYINSCNGLVCLSNESSDVIYIWNPATKRLKKLPTPIKDLSNVRVADFFASRSLKGIFRDKLTQGVFLGFGFDPISNDYKLLRIVFQNRSGSAEMYSANTDSWKEIQIPESLRRYRARSKFFQAKTGLLYIECCSGLLAFDLHSEVFRLYPFPSLSPMSEVLDYEGYVAMIFESTDGSGSLYKLDDDVCAEVSWTKMFNLEADFKISWVNNYLGNGQFVVEHLLSSFCIYDYKKREHKTILLLSADEGMRLPIKYTESLVSLDGFEEQEKLSGVHFDIDLTHRRKEVVDIVEEIIKKGSTEREEIHEDHRAIVCTILKYLYGQK